MGVRAPAAGTVPGRRRSGVAGEHPTLDRVALGLLVASLVASLVLVGPLVRPRDVAVVIALGPLLGAGRLWLVLHPGSRLRPVVYWGGLLICLVLVALAPPFGLYAFTAYAESSLVNAPGVRRWAALLLTAAVVALAQLGGPRSPYASWPLYLAFVAINLLVAVSIGLVEKQRDRTMVRLQETVAELEAAEQRNSALADQLVAQAREAGAQDERARLSREIHDTVAQELVGIITQLEAASAATDPDERALRVRRADQGARQALSEARRAVRALASPRLDDATLPAAVGALVDQVRETTGLDARCVVDGDPVPGIADGELLRVVQESLTNVVRHARATRVVVSLSYAADGVRLDVRDDGVGFDPGTQARGHGIPGMRQRLAAVGGTLELETREGGGCTVSAAIPR